MSTYQELHGFRVNVVSSNPSNPKEGEIWYNSTLGEIKSYLLSPATWSSGGALNAGRSLAGADGTQTAAFMVAGLDSSTYKNNTEKYNGTAWTASGNYPSSVYGLGAAGTQTAGLAFGGAQPGPDTNVTAEYDGSTWTAVPGNFPVSGSGMTGFGTQTAAISNLPSSDVTVAYDGSTWTAFGSPGNMNTSRLDGVAQNGTQTAGLMFTGRTNPGPVNTAATEEWNGSTWTSSNNYPVAMVFAQGCGTQTAAVGFGGDKPPGEAAQTTTCTYDGSTWTAASALGSAVTRQSSAKSGTQTSALSFGGIGPSGGGAGLTATEEFTGAVEIRTLTTS
jgi:hypothetical protein